MPDLLPLSASQSPPTDSSAAFRCRPVEKDGRVQLTLSGELDIAGVPLLDRALRRAWSSSDQVVLDLRVLQFIDVSAAHMLLAAHRRIHRAGGRLIVVRGPEEVSWLLRLIGIEELLDVVDEPPAGDRATNGERAPTRTPRRGTARAAAIN